MLSTVGVDPVSQKSRRRTADIAYGCYLWIALFFAVGKLLDVIFGSPDSSEGFAVLQGVGMLVVLPLALASIAAAILATKSSLKLCGGWLKESGLVVLPLLLLLLVVSFTLDEGRYVPKYWVQISVAAYVLAAFIFSIRWFASARKQT